MALTIADGQVAASATQILDGASNTAQRGVSVMFSNTGNSSETVVVTFKRQGGTARRIAYAVLAQNESLLITGLKITSGDTLLASASDASVVDYLITGEQDGPYTVSVFDANGCLKTVANGTGSTANLSATGTITGTSASASALAVGRQGATSPGLQLDASTSTCVTGLKITPAAAGSGLALAVVGGNSAEALTLDAKGSGTISIGTVSTGAITLGAATGVTGALTGTSSSASALTVGRQGATNPVLQVDASTATVLTGLKVKGAGTGAGCALSVVETGGTNNKLTVDAMGAGQIELGDTSTGIVVLGRGALKQTVQGLTKTDVNSQNAAPTAAQWLGGYITHNSQTAGGTLTTPTGANISAAYTGAATGDSFWVVYQNRGNQTVTLTAGDGNVTLKGTVAIPTLKTAFILFNCTGANTWDAVNVLSA